MTETNIPTDIARLRNWSAEQLDIFNEFEHGTGNAVVVARAGTGKTTTGVEGVKRAPERSILYGAFNKKIAEELASRFKGASNVTVKTFHAIGCGVVFRYWERVTVDFGSARADELAKTVCGGTVPDAVVRLVSKLHSKGRELAPHARNIGDLTDIAIRFECEPPEQWENEGYDLNFIEMKALEAMEVGATVKSRVIDGADMIFLPLRNNWLRPTYDLVVVDEAQDMNPPMLEMAQKLCRGRIIVIGDDRQAIYAFRGADSDALARLERELDAKRLTLTTTYRCGKNIVKLAQELVPDFKAADNNPEGTISSVSSERLLDVAGPGNFILSRMNAPLVSVAMGLLRRGKRARIAGRDIGKGLIALIRKLKARSVPDFISKVQAWADREEKRLLANFKGKGPVAENAAYMSRLDAVRDQAQMLTEIADECRNVDEVITRIEHLFTDDGLGDAGIILCSSVHKSKGLEADKVFVLQSTLRDNTTEELNIAYVAITRAKSELVWVN